MELLKHFIHTQKTLKNGFQTNLKKVFFEDCPDHKNGHNSAPRPPQKLRTYVQVAFDVPHLFKRVPGPEKLKKIVFLMIFRIFLKLGGGIFSIFHMISI